MEGGQWIGAPEPQDSNTTFLLGSRMAWVHPRLHLLQCLATDRQGSDRAGFSSTVMTEGPIQSEHFTSGRSWQAAEYILQFYQDSTKLTAPRFIFHFISSSEPLKASNSCQPTLHSSALITWSLLAWLDWWASAQISCQCRSEMAA